MGKEKQRGKEGLRFMESTRKTLRGELALVVIVIINSFGVVLMLHSGSGISAISSVPYDFSEVLPKLSLGTWTYLFQACLVATLFLLRRKFVPEYLFSFVVGFFFGNVVDLHQLWVSKLPNTLPLDILYFVISYLVICFGIALFEPVPDADHPDGPVSAGAGRYYGTAVLEDQDPL